MSFSLQIHPASDLHIAYYWSGDAIRSRIVSGVVLSGKVEVPAPPARLVANWQREISQRLVLEPGDVEALPLARARMRWPDYTHCVREASDWTRSMGLQGVLAASDVALMVCQGARYHHDGAQYGGFAFCNLFLSEDRGLDLHFPATGHRIPLFRGTVVVFDTCQPHAVIERNSSSGFDAADFPPHQERSQVFLTWELPIEDAPITDALHITFDVDPETASRLREGQVWRNGAPVKLCPHSGQWLAAE
jgi:hypothetical protein